MNQQELKKLKRADLLEMLLAQSRENEELRNQLEAARAQLNSRMLTCENAGSIAEASLQLNGVFEAAQAACAQYVENITYLSAKQEQKCAQMEQETKRKCEQMVTEARQQAAAYWNEVYNRIQNFNVSYTGLRQVLERYPAITVQDDTL